MKPVTIIRHIKCEGPGYLENTLKKYKIPVRLIAIDQGDVIPATPADTSGLIIMGGPMSVNDDDEWISRETGFIRDAIDKDLPVLGHCLGGQFIAKALGARITANPVKEIGWLPVTATNSQRQPEWLAQFKIPQYVFHWHGETFDVPEGARPLLSSEHCANQAFIYKDNVLAFQCHIEMKADMIDEWSTLYSDEISQPSETIQSREEMMKLTGEHIRQLNRLADSVYEAWVTHLG